MFNLCKIFIIIFISFINFGILAQRNFYNLNNNENFYLISNKDTLYKSLGLKNACQFKNGQLSRINKGAITDTLLLAFLIEKLYLPKNADKSEPIRRFEGGKEEFVNKLKRQITFYRISSYNNKNLDFIFIHTNYNDDFNMKNQDSKILLVVTVKNKIKSAIILSNCIKNNWFGEHSDFKMENNKIFITYMTDYSDNISYDNPEDGVEKKEAYTIFPNGCIKLTSKWKHKRKG